MKYGIKIHTEYRQYIAVFEDREKTKSAFWMLRYLETAEMPAEEKLKTISEVFSSVSDIIIVLNDDDNFLKSVSDKEDPVEVIFNGNYIHLNHTLMTCYSQKYLAKAMLKKQGLDPKCREAWEKEKKSLEKRLDWRK